TRDVYVEILLGLTKDIVKVVGDEFHNELGMEYNNPTALKEATYFSLFIMLPHLDSDSKSRKIYHDEIVKAFAPLYGLTKDEMLTEIENRYGVYFDAFDTWKRNPESGHMIGSAMVELIKNNNPNLSLGQRLPSVSDVDAMKAFNIFFMIFSLHYESMEKLHKKVKLVG
ncbi:MAG: hypothetical protein QF830_08300, partial [Rhodospirillales bacterium]|nr:hypothetical protein [Rhodospirillales bacterium]